MIINTQFQIKNVFACSMFNPYEGYRSVTPRDAARVNRTILHNHIRSIYDVILRTIILRCSLKVPGTILLYCSAILLNCTYFEVVQYAYAGWRRSDMQACQVVRLFIVASSRYYRVTVGVPGTLVPVAPVA